jgi:ribosomal protein L34E
MATVSNRSRSSTKEHRCSICGKTFDSIETLNSHKTMEHS